MPVPTTNVKLSDIQAEFGGSNPISLSEYYRGGENVPSSTTSAYGTIPTFGQINMGVFRGTQKPRVSINNLRLNASVGSTFNGTASTSLTFQSSGSLTYDISVQNGADPGRSVDIRDASENILDSGETSISGSVSGMWKLSENASDYEIYISKSGAYTSISGASENTWTNMNTNITLSVTSTINDAIDQTFSVQIRRASNQEVLDSATFTMNALAAGIN